MGIITFDTGRYKGQERFLFETEDERLFLEHARNYFRQTPYLLFKEGLGIGTNRKSAAPRFNTILNGAYYTGGKCTISLEAFELIKIYAERFRMGERYDEETFVRPEL